MPTIFTKIIPVLLAGCAFLPAQASAREVLDRFDFDLTGGYRVDQLDWNIAGNIDGNNPDILSELTWDDLESYQISGQARVIMTNEQASVGGVVRLGASYGDIYSGTNQDSDYSGDGRTGEFSRSNNSADSGYVWDGSLGGGMLLCNRSRTFSFSPLLGFSQHQQNLTISEGRQTLSESADAPAVGPIAGLDSTYETEWRSGWLGFDLEYVPNPHFGLHGGVEVHSGRYEAEGNWNLRTDLEHPRSFRHTSDDAQGVVANIGMRAGLRNLLLLLDVKYQKWEASDGENRIYFSNGAIGVSRLNEVNWEAYSVNAGVTVRF